MSLCGDTDIFLRGSLSPTRPGVRWRQTQLRAIFISGPIWSSSTCSSASECLLRQRANQMRAFSSFSVAFFSKVGKKAFFWQLYSPFFAPEGSPRSPPVRTLFVLASSDPPLRKKLAFSLPPLFIFSSSVRSVLCLTLLAQIKGRFLFVPTCESLCLDLNLSHPSHN